MTIKNRQEPFLLFLGDIFAFFAALWLTLVIRYLEVPSEAMWEAHLLPFSVIIGISFIVFVIAGLYGKHTTNIRTKLPSTIFSAQVTNAILALLVFYFIPFFGITPKTNLFIYLILSTGLIFAWRLAGGKFFEIGKKQKIVLIGKKAEAEEIAAEVQANERYGLVVSNIFDIDIVSEDEINAVFNSALHTKDCIVVADSDNPKVASALSKNYDLILSTLIFFDIHWLYEQMFDRVPVNSVNYLWLIDYNKSSIALYDIVKRIMDLVIALPFFLITLPFFPLAALLIKLEDRGQILITQERVGKRGKKVYLYKFRTMNRSDEGVWLGESENKVTKVGYFLRKSRIDELPQLLNVIKGDISLIGPRPDIVGLGNKLVEAIPYYMTRYIVPPGLSGWAQIQQKPPQSIEENKLRFSYDLFYVKNRSIFLDLVIGLRTIKTLLSRTGM
ncbi:MAG: hypothetical protein RL094_29 [Candidatus Parcubacteria bacterium]|jgi:lipopolysaccharide/colanic/teichoic acid biosynthesis glycosyltransferase